MLSARTRFCSNETEYKAFWKQTLKFGVKKKDGYTEKSLIHAITVSTVEDLWWFGTVFLSKAMGILLE